MLNVQANSNGYNEECRDEKYDESGPEGILGTFANVQEDWTRCGWYGWAWGHW